MIDGEFVHTTSLKHLNSQRWESRWLVTACVVLLLGNVNTVQVMYRIGRARGVHRNTISSALLILYWYLVTYYKKLIGSRMWSVEQLHYVEWPSMVISLMQLVKYYHLLCSWHIGMYACTICICNLSCDYSRTFISLSHTHAQRSSADIVFTQGAIFRFLSRFQPSGLTTDGIQKVRRVQWWHGPPLSSCQVWLKANDALRCDATNCDVFIFFLLCHTFVPFVVDGVGDV